MRRRFLGARAGVLAAVVTAAALAAAQGCADNATKQDVPGDPGAEAADAVPADADIVVDTLADGDADLADAVPAEVDIVVDTLADGDAAADGDAIDATDAGDADAAGDVVDATDAPLPDGTELPVTDPAAAARAFKLYYRERVERTIVAYNRFMLFGDTTFGINIRKAGISRKGDTFEVVPGPNDNNSIGTSVRATWYAWKQFRSRLIAASLVRMFKGMAFIATVSGHDGVTGRNAYPNWTMVIDGTAGTVQRTRSGAAVSPPTPPDAALESEILSTFFGGIRVTYRGEPPDILLAYMPAQEVGPYAVTYGFSMLPDYLRVSDCCTSLMHVPEPYAWAGAFWSNHNSRDNFPDLAFGYLAAREAMDDPDADADVRAAAAEAWKAGQAMGDSVESNGGRIMTVLETGPYDQLVPSGTVRPDGTTESEDLGSMSDCQMAFLARALSSAGLTLPLPVLPEPGALDKLIYPLFEGCPTPDAGYTCTRLADAFCGATWGHLNDLLVNGTGLIDLETQLEAENPGSANAILGHFYGNYDQPLNSALATVAYAKAVGNGALLAAATSALAEMTSASRLMADLIYAKTNPSEQARRRYQTALVDAQGGLPPVVADLGDFASAEQQMTWLESVLDLADTADAALITDADIATRVQSELSGASDAVKTRYKDAWGTTPPLRRTADGYEARTFGPGGAGDWHAVATPHHLVFGGIDLLEALPLCETTPGLMDCKWARLGCARPDLDHDGVVGESDRTLMQQAMAAGASGCSSANAWCSGADLDHTGSVDAVDVAFMDAAQGCHYSVAGH